MKSNESRRFAFCNWYIALGNVREAAVRAGCPPDSAEAEGLKMLRSPVSRRYLAALSAAPPVPIRSLVIAGLSRLAFGSVNDAAKLACMDQLSDDALSQLDLFHVTSIKHDKNGFEIKLADRVAAMDRLLACAADAESADAAADLLAALRGDPNDERGDPPEHALPVLPETTASPQLVAQS